jgi:hypothetical protein
VPALEANVAELAKLGLTVSRRMKAFGLKPIDGRGEVVSGGLSSSPRYTNGKVTQISK